MSGNRCHYMDCNQSQFKTKGLRMFTIPKKNMRMWIKNCGEGNPKLVGVTEAVLERRQLRVCERHFHPKDILPSGRLMHGTVPIPYEKKKDNQDEIAKLEEEEEEDDVKFHLDVYKDLDVYKTPDARSYAKPSPIESMMSVSLSEQTTLPERDPLASADSDGSTEQGSHFMLPKRFKSAIEMETQASAGPSNIESEPCASSTKIRFDESEISSLHDLDFGSLGESSMAHPLVSTSFGEGTSTETQGDVAAEKENDEENKELESSPCAPTDTAVVSLCRTVVGDVADAIQSTGPSTDGATVLPTIKTVDPVPLKRTCLHEPKPDTKISSGSDKVDIIAKELASAVQRLETVSNKMIAASLADKFDKFGKYISSLMRGLPAKKVNSLKNKIVSDVLDALYEEEEPFKNKKTVGVQVGLDVPAAEVCNRRHLKEQAQGANPGLSADVKSLLGGNMAMCASTSNSSYKLLPVIPMSAPSIISTATVVTTPTIIGSVAPVQSLLLAPPVQPLPLTPYETVTTVAQSADGTLLAVNLPKSQMPDSLTGPDQTQAQSQRKQKRKQSLTAAYLIKESVCVSPTTATSPDDHCSAGGPAISSNERAQTESNHQPLEKSKYSKCGSHSNRPPLSADQLMANEDEFEMDIEEGNELVRIKEDFESVMCETSSELYIKEEAPDPDPDPDSVPGSPPRSPHLLICALCNKQFDDRDQVIRHFSVTHPGCVPSAKDACGASYALT